MPWAFACKWNLQCQLWIAASAAVMTFDDGFGHQLTTVFGCFSSHLEKWTGSPEQVISQPVWSVKEAEHIFHCVFSGIQGAIWHHSVVSE